MVLERILLDDDYRSHLIAGGLERSRLFSWKKSVNETMLVLREALEA